MGVYLYAVRSKKTKVHFADRVVEANHFQYAMRAPSWRDEDSAWYKRWVSRHATIWKDRQPTEILVSAHDSTEWNEKSKYKLTDGSTVYWNRNGLTSAYDTSMGNMEEVGVLRKRGGVWYVVDAEADRLAYYVKLEANDNISPNDGSYTAKWNEDAQGNARKMHTKIPFPTLERFKKETSLSQLRWQLSARLTTALYKVIEELGDLSVEEYLATPKLVVEWNDPDQSRKDESDLRWRVEGTFS